MSRPQDRIDTSKEERVARLSLKQGIIVALITALSGLGGAVIQKASSSSTKQDWLYIYGVDIPNSEEARVRVVAVVNGHAYSYPSRAVWMSGGEMTEEKFALPVGSTNYDVSFSLLSLVGGQVLMHQSEEVVHASSPTGRLKYKAYKLSSDGSHWGRSRDSVEIRYEIRPY